MNKIKHDQTIDLPAIARLTVGFSPAEIKNLVNKAAYKAVESKKTQVSQEHLNFAFERIKLGIKSKHIVDD